MYLLTSCQLVMLHNIVKQFNEHNNSSHKLHYRLHQNDILIVTTEHRHILNKKYCQGGTVTTINNDF